MWEPGQSSPSLSNCTYIDRTLLQALKWRAIAAFDVVTEFMLVIMPIVIVWPLQMAVNLKVQVIAAFTFRLGSVSLRLLNFQFLANQGGQRRCARHCARCVRRSVRFCKPPKSCHGTHHCLRRS